MQSIWEITNKDSTYDGNLGPDSCKYRKLSYLNIKIYLMFSLEKFFLKINSNSSQLNKMYICLT